LPSQHCRRKSRALIHLSPLRTIQKLAEQAIAPFRILNVIWTGHIIEVKRTMLPGRIAQSVQLNRVTTQLQKHANKSITSYAISPQAELP
jgi:hypothetical protein